MKRSSISALTIITFCLVAFRAAAETPVDLSNIGRKADVIAEGIVITQADASDRQIPGHVGQSQEAVIFDVGNVKNSSIKITQVFKGNITTGEEIIVYAYPQLPLEVTELVLNKRYILFLKQIPFKPGYAILDNGRRSWRVFDYEGIAKVKAWNDVPDLENIKNFENYETFIKRLKESILIAD